MKWQALHVSCSAVKRAIVPYTCSLHIFTWQKILVTAKLNDETNMTTERRCSKHAIGFTNDKVRSSNILFQLKLSLNSWLYYDYQRSTSQFFWDKLLFDYHMKDSAKFATEGSLQKNLFNNQFKDSSKFAKRRAHWKRKRQQSTNSTTTLNLQSRGWSDVSNTRRSPGKTYKRKTTLNFALTKQIGRILLLLV